MVANTPRNMLFLDLLVLLPDMSVMTLEDSSPNIFAENHIALSSSTSKWIYLLINILAEINDNSRLEKASREFVTVFLQVLDDGRLTDGQGRVVDFRNTVIIFTSNVGSSFLTEMGEGAVPPHIRTAVNNAIRSTWPPEFLNRIDSIIIYVSKLISTQLNLLRLDIFTHK